MTEVTQDSSLEALVGEVADEFLNRQRQGERPEVEEYLKRYPEAPLLRNVLEALRLVEISQADVAALTSSPAEGMPTGTLGDFQLLQEVGRGGMGVVYEATQISLDRRVALKVLPFAAMLDARHLQRFQNEARAAACLQHPHIVPVHAVGCERGVHYYAMQFIEGQSLEAVLRELRPSPKQTSPPVAKAPGSTPSVAPPDAVATVAQESPPPVEERGSGEKQTDRETVRVPRGQTSTLPSPQQGTAYFRRVAELMMEAAEALEHAHQLGIIHRDIKPANLLLDDRGKLWITDFGLAQINNDVRLTMTGDLVGTLRYMSPEQALAKRVIVDHRTDVYSLGATLHEMLTLQPAFTGTDRQELLRQIAFEEPPAPRRINKATPVELESIVFKAMEKNPTDRYGTAKEMADDLQRYLKDEPIQARQPSVLQRSRKWILRHPTVSWSVAAGLLAAVATLAGAAGFWISERAAREEAAQREQQTRETEAERVRESREMVTEQAVNVAFQEADRFQKARKMREALARAKQAAGILAAGAGTPALDKRVHERLADLKLVVDLEEIRGRRLSGFVWLLSDTEIDMDLARVFAAYGIDFETMAPEEAAQRIRARTVALEVAAAIDSWAYMIRFAEWSKKTEPPRRWQRLLEVARLADPDPWRNKVRLALAEKEGDAVHALLAEVNADELLPATALFIAEILTSTGKVDQALQLLQKVQPRHADDAWLNWELAFHIHFNGAKIGIPNYKDESNRLFAMALALRPDDSNLHMIVATGLLDSGRLDQAIAILHEAIRLQADDAHHHLFLGRALAKKGLPDEAIAAYKKTIELSKNDAEAYNGLGEIYLLDKKQPDLAIAAFQEAIALRPNYADAHWGLGNAYGQKQQLEKAIAAYQQAVTHKKNFPEAYLNLGNCFMAKGQFDKAIAAYLQAVAFKKDYAEAHHNLGLSYARKAEFDQAIIAFQQAVAHKKDYVDAYVNLASAYLEKHQPDSALDALQQAMAFKKDSAELYVNLGAAHRLKGNYEVALAAFQKGHQLAKKNPDLAQLAATAIKDVEQHILVQNQLKMLTKVGQAQEFKAQIAKTDPLIQGKPSKVHPIQLKGGHYYVIDLMSTEFDAYLLIRDAAGKVLAEDDDGGEGMNSRLLFTPPADGTYEIVAQAFAAGTGGSYTLLIQQYQRVDVKQK